MAVVLRDLDWAGDRVSPASRNDVKEGIVEGYPLRSRCDYTFLMHIATYRIGIGVFPPPPLLA